MAISAVNNELASALINRPFKQSICLILHGQVHAGIRPDESATRPEAEPLGKLVNELQLKVSKYICLVHRRKAVKLSEELKQAKRQVSSSIDEGVKLN